MSHIMASVVAACIFCARQDPIALLGDVELPNVVRLAAIPTPLDAHIPNDAGRFASHVPTPLSRKDIDWIVRDLSLSPPQVMYLDTCLGAYHPEMEYVRQTLMPDIAYWSERAVASLDYKPGYAACVAEFARRERVARRRVEAAEQALFGAMNEILAESQQSCLQIVVDKRARAARCIWLVTTPSATIDLVAFVGPLNLSPDARRLLDEYARQVTPLFREMTDELLERRVPESRLLATFVKTGDQAADAERLERFLRDNASIRRKGARLEARIRDLNAATVDRIAAAMDQATAKSVLETFRSSGYPNVFPDAGEAHTALQTLRSYAEEDATVLAAFDGIVGSYKTQHEGNCQRIIRLSDELHDHLSLTGSTRGSLDLQRRVAEAVATRAETNSAALQQAKAMLESSLSPETGVEIQRLIDLNRGLQFDIRQSR